MKKSGWIAAITFGGLALGATAFASPPIAFKPGPAQVRAEQSCQSQDVRPNSAAWELCLAHVTRASEWGEPALARQLARAASQARESCLNEILGDDDSGDNVAKVSQ